MPVFTIDKSLPNQKKELLAYLRERSSEFAADISQKLGTSRRGLVAKGIVGLLKKEEQQLLAQVQQQARLHKWPNDALLRASLLIAHCTSVVMFDSRNEWRPYEYMDFSRRVGERWEHLCLLCFDFPINTDVSLFTPPLYKDVKVRLHSEVTDYINSLPLSKQQKNSLLGYYDRVWSVMDAAMIRLSLDLHFMAGQKRFVVDLKSGFGSNEKGNMNRLLVVGTIYTHIEQQDYTCMMWVRSKEERNNNYLKTLKKSGVWEVSCGEEAYAKIKQSSGFDAAKWINANVAWNEDLLPSTLAHLKKSDLMGYMEW